MKDKMVIVGDLMSPAQFEAYRENAREFLATYVELEKIHGHTKVALACAMVNATTMISQLERSGASAALVLALQKTMEHMLTEWGTLAKVGQEELDPIVRGLLAQVGIASVDIDAATTTTGEKDGPRT
jgi:hypothetical protein